MTVYPIAVLEVVLDQTVNHVRRWESSNQVVIPFARRPCVFVDFRQGVDGRRRREGGDGSVGLVIVAVGGLRREGMVSSRTSGSGNVADRVKV